MPPPFAMADLRVVVVLVLATLLSAEGTTQKTCGAGASVASDGSCTREASDGREDDVSGFAQLYADMHLRTTHLQVASVEDASSAQVPMALPEAKTDVKASCPRPAGWCTHGAVYLETDCDGDGNPDHYCYDAPTSYSGFISTKYGCYGTWPYGGCQVSFSWIPEVNLRPACSNAHCPYPYCGTDGGECKPGNQTGTCAYFADLTPRLRSDHAACCTSVYVGLHSTGDDCAKLGCYYWGGPAKAQRFYDGGNGMTCWPTGMLYIGGYATPGNNAADAEAAFAKATFDDDPCELFDESSKCIHAGTRGEMKLGGGADAGKYSLQVMLKCAEEQKNAFLRVLLCRPPGRGAYCNGNTYTNLESFSVTLDGTSYNMLTADAVSATPIFGQVYDETWGPDGGWWRMVDLNLGTGENVVNIEIVAQSNALAFFTFEMHYVTKTFERCMDAKECLRIIGNPDGYHLRNDNTAQLACLNGDLPNDPVCTNWKDCTDGQESTDMLKAILSAALTSSSSALLESGYALTDSTEDDPGCMDPRSALADADAYDCDCYPTLIDLCPGASPGSDCIKGHLCQHGSVCSSWKGTAGCSSSALSLATRASANKSKAAMAHEQQHKDKTTDDKVGAIEGVHRRKSAECNSLNRLRSPAIDELLV